jgi:hypothetical protein
MARTTSVSKNQRSGSMDIKHHTFLSMALILIVLGLWVTNEPITRQIAMNGEGVITPSDPKSMVFSAENFLGAVAELSGDELLVKTDTTNVKVDASEAQVYRLVIISAAPGTGGVVPPPSTGEKKVNFSELKVNDRINVQGSVEGETFIASKIIILGAGTPPPPPSSEPN